MAIEPRRQLAVPRPLNVLDHSVFERRGIKPVSRAVDRIAGRSRLRDKRVVGVESESDLPEGGGDRSPGVAPCDPALAVGQAAPGLSQSPNRLIDTGHRNLNRDVDEGLLALPSYVPAPPPLKTLKALLACARQIPASPGFVDEGSPARNAKQPVARRLPARPPKCRVIGEGAAVKHGPDERQVVRRELSARAVLRHQFRSPATQFVQATWLRRLSPGHFAGLLKISDVAPTATLFERPYAGWTAWKPRGGFARVPVPAIALAFVPDSFSDRHHVTDNGMSRS
jgi:hypothetical protein